MAGERGHAVAFPRRVTTEDRLRDTEPDEDDGPAPEDVTAEVLAQLPREWRVFHDVAWPGRHNTTIDHVVVGPQGIFVIDTQAFAGEIGVRAGVLLKDGRRHAKATSDAAGAASAIGGLAPWLDPTAVRPVLCVINPRPVFGWAGEVMVCSTENLLTLMTSRPKVLAERTVHRTAELLGPTLLPLVAPVAQLPRPSRAATTRPVPGPTRAGRPRSSPPGMATTIPALIALAVAVGLAIQLHVPNQIGAFGTKTVREMRMPTEPVGHTFTIAGGTGRPAVDVTAGAAVDTVPTRLGDTVAVDRELLAVPMTIRNRGDQAWVSVAGTRLHAYDDLDLSYRPDPTATQVRAGPVLTSQFRVPPGKTLRRFVVFDVPKGTRLVQLKLSVGPDAPKTVRWTTPE